MTKYILVFLLLVVSAISHTQNPNDLFKQANEAYLEKSYNQAVELYESIYDQGLKSPELFLNMGNAHYQNAHYAKAILAYERGLKLSPNDHGILENLEIANNQLDSEIIEVPPFILVRWWRSFSNIFSTSIWAILQVLFLGLIAFFTGFYFLNLDIGSRKKNLARVVFICPLLLISVLAGITKDKSQQDVTAVIMSETSLTDGPDARAGEINKLYPGNKVLLLDQIDNWHKVRLANQSVGWIEAETFEKI